MTPHYNSSSSSGSRIQRNSPGVKTICQITHSCGHQAERDLSDRAADRPGMEELHDALRTTAAAIQP
ncbi:hypothetical protein [Streptomyces sp. NPDC051286]|uniref:hypothetical protein n=1 Tax=Streptomyces sp. NPDC051286 TaxID=3365647 RepID=UPI00378C9E3F